MRVKTAKEIATRWIVDEIAPLPGFAGAFFHGSINWMAKDEEIAATSDVDVMLVFDEGAFDEGAYPETIGKFRQGDLLIEASIISTQSISTAAAVLAQYPIVGGFRKPGIILDPTGHLTRLQAEIAPEYARRHQVEARCAAARARIIAIVDEADSREYDHDRVTAWLFSAGIVTHIPLLAGLKNPTVRRRYLAVREVLTEYGLDAIYPQMLAPIGADRIDAARTSYHIGALTAAFDCAGQVLRSPYRFAADMRPDARAVALGGSAELIAGGNHREAIFWMVAVYSRAMHVLTADGTPAQRVQHGLGYRAFLHDLGIEGDDDLRHGMEKTVALLPVVWQIAEEIMARNPEIVP